MSENKGLDLLDYLVIIIKWKKFLIILSLITLVVSYAGVYYFIEEEYSSSATIIPIEDNSLGGLAGLAKNLSSLPIGGLGNLKKSSEMDIYNTILFSRTSLEKMADTFKLDRLYKFQTREQKLKVLSSMISTSISLENAFNISVRAKTPKLAADITNYLVDYLNSKVIELNTNKSKDNRQFIEERYAEVKANLKLSEDSLRRYQQASGVLEAENQTKATIDAYAKMESELASKQIEAAVLKKVYGENSVQLNNALLALQEYKEKVDKIKSGQDKSSMFLPMASMPAKIMDYYRLYRNVKINSEMLEFIIPLYEQARFEEQKAIPVIQVIDRAVAPERKSYPPRTLFALIITFCVGIFATSLILVKELTVRSENPKMVFIRKNLFRFRTSPSQLQEPRN